MFVKVDEMTSNGREYRYVRIVRSYRRESDGQPTHEVVANLGDLSEDATANLKAAFEASRNGERVVVGGQAGEAVADELARPAANLGYLDVAVLREMWADWELAELIDELVPVGEREEVEPSNVVEALALQRCVAPGSKLEATRWFDRTALPELMAVEPGAFNNTRVHRVLERVAASRPKLVRELAARYGSPSGDELWTPQFLDVTDAYFEGRGPEIAERGRTKQEMVRHKIGIGLMCNRSGYPVHWRVVPGNRHDSRTCRSIFDELCDASWLEQTPIVVDRALGKTTHIEEMLDRGVRFVTAIHRSEMPTYAPELPYGELGQLDCKEGDPSREELVDRARNWALEHGFAQHRETMYVREVGETTLFETTDGSPSDDEDRTVYAMRIARAARRLREAGDVGSWAAAADRHGLSKGTIYKYRKLLELPDALQQRVLAGEAAGQPIKRLVDVATLEDDEETVRQAFEELVESAPTKPGGKAGRRKGRQVTTATVQVAAYFNPERWVDRRLNARSKLEAIEAWIDELNERLARPTSRMTHDTIVGRVHQRLREEGMVTLYEVTIEDGQVELELDEQAWRHRRRLDGLSVIVSHPANPMGAVRLCELYRAKDCVEKDFGIIKGDVEIRPIRHRLDPKVRAHVTICMLALLLERTLEARLSEELTARAALEILGTAHLNAYETSPDAPPVYLPTRPDDRQRDILEQLDLEKLGDDGEIDRRITPRQNLL